MTGPTVVPIEEEVFAAPRACFEELLGWIGGTQATGLSHGELEEQLDARGRELLRQLFQGQLELRARTEQRVPVIDAEGVRHASVESGHSRPLGTVFGTVAVSRFGYRHRGHANLYLADALLNLPTERHSHGVRKLAALAAARGSFGEAATEIGRRTGAPIGKRQVETLAARAATDVQDFYATRTPAAAAATTELLVISADGKGIVMRPDSLRPKTAAAAATESHKLKSRLTKGEKRNRKRMAEVGAVYDLTPMPRTASDILTGPVDPPDGPAEPAAPCAAAPKATNKWVTASVVEDPADVLALVFDEAQRRDPTHQRSWVALVDGNNHQIDRVKAEAAQRGVTVPIIIDFIHVLEYLWVAAWCFYPQADPAAETWVQQRALAVLNGGARTVAAGLRRRASTEQLPTAKRRLADRAARYLTNKASYLDYPTALAAGWPIATGVIEGTCRHLVKDRMDITGARWSAAGAEAILKLRAVRINDDFDAYWNYHLQREQQRIHQTRYLNGDIPRAA